MSGVSVFDRRPVDRADPSVFGLLAKPLPVLEAAKDKTRSKIWTLSSHLHCSIIGTCLTAAELRQFFVKLGDADARTATDHVLHGRGVRTAGQRDIAGKLLHKALDKRHETAIKRFAKAASTAEVKALWQQALDQGEIPGAYWAVLTHPETDYPLVQDVFGEVHMLSHMVGSANRVDIARLRRLERELGDREEKIARQEQRLQAAAQERDILSRRVGALEAELGQRRASEQARPDPVAADMPALLQRYEAERAHAGNLAARLKQSEALAQSADKRAADLQAQNAQLQREVAALERSFQPDAESALPAAGPDLCGQTFLYVGGRPRLVDQLQSLTARHGGTLLAHDGGVEDNAALLPGLVSQADRVFFPVDCVSHMAVGQIKKLCRDAGKAFVPLRTAGLASFVAAITADKSAS